MSQNDFLDGILHRKKPRRAAAGKRMSFIIDELSFKKIFLLWMLLILLFGVAYHFASNGTSYLYHTQTQDKVASLLDAVYFSFVTATTTGFGDIVPFGLFKALAISEVLLALLLLAIVTSKLVSIKQNAILSETYEISLNEKMYRFRSSLLLFRQHMERIIVSIDEGKMKKREVANMHTHFTILEDTIREMLSIMKRSEGNTFLKSFDEVNSELLANSVLNSLNKIEELIKDMEKHKISWRSDCNTLAVKKALEMSAKFMDSVELQDKAIEWETRKWFEEITETLRKRVPEGRPKRVPRC